MIPRKFHFVFFTEPVGKLEVKPFILHNYICIKSCYLTQSPDEINIYINGNEPKNNPYWDEIRQYINVVRYNFDIEVGGKEISPANHICDLARAEIVYNNGGIYYDIDTLFISKIPDSILNTEKCIFAIELLNTEPGYRLMSDTIMGVKHNKFLNFYIKNKGLIHTGYAYYSGGFPTSLWKNGCRDLDGVLLHNFGTNTWDAIGSPKFYSGPIKSLEGSYSIAMCQSANWEYLKNLTDKIYGDMNQP